MAVLGAPGPSQDAPECSPQPGVVEFEQDGFRYAYHAPTGTESLIDMRESDVTPRNVMSEHVDIGRKMRRALEEKLNVRSLDDLRSEYSDTIRRLHSLGYL